MPAGAQASPEQFHVATVYSGACDGQGNFMADGTRIEGNGSLAHLEHGRWKHVDEHVLASSFLALGTRIRFAQNVFGSRNWVVRDSGGEFDLYRPNCNWSGWPGLTNPRLGYWVIR